MKKKPLIILILFITIASIIFVYFFNKSNYKTSNSGNNNLKSISDFEEYILNISSYEANISVEVTSNKNTNKYIIEQKYFQPNIYKQEVLEPSNIKGVITTYDGSTLTVQNTHLELSKIYENYECISDNFLCLHHFAENYKKSAEKNIKEENGAIKMEVKLNDEGNKYNKYQVLYIDKKSGKPFKMTVQDINQNTLVYILYNEIKINSTSKEEALAFELNINRYDI